MTYTVQLDFFIDEDFIRGDEQVVEVLREMFDYVLVAHQTLEYLK